MPSNLPPHRNRVPGTISFAARTTPCGLLRAPASAKGSRTFSSAARVLPENGPSTSSAVATGHIPQRSNPHSTSHFGAGSHGTAGCPKPTRTPYFSGRQHSSSRAETRITVMRPWKQWRSVFRSSLSSESQYQSTSKSTVQELSAKQRLTGSPTRSKQFNETMPFAKHWSLMAANSRR